MFKLRISSIFNFDQAHPSWISGVLGVKDFISYVYSLDIKNRVSYYVRNEFWKSLRKWKISQIRIFLHTLHNTQAIARKIGLLSHIKTPLNPLDVGHQRKVYYITHELVHGFKVVLLKAFKIINRWVGSKGCYLTSNSFLESHNLSTR